MVSLSTRRLRARNAADRLVAACLTELESAPKTREHLRHLLCVIHSRSSLVDLAPVGGRVCWVHLLPALRAIVALAGHMKSRLRDPEDWVPPAAGRFAQLRSLAEHLYARDPLPAFLLAAWLLDPNSERQEEQQWYLHLGRGYSIRGVKLPLAYTAAMAKEFLRAPDDLTVRQALRWGEVRALGIPAILCRPLVTSILGSSFRYSARWHGFFRLLIGAEDLPPHWVRPMVEYLSFHPTELLRLQKMGFESCRWRRQDLQRRARTWYTGDFSPEAPRQWPSMNVRPLQWCDDFLRLWCSRELLTAAELTLEGKRMRHCVGTYAPRCKSQKSSIWSFTVTGIFQAHEPVMTVEIRPKERLIVQALGRSNRPITTEARRALTVWAENERLSIGYWV